MSVTIVLPVDSGMTVIAHIFIGMGLYYTLPLMTAVAEMISVLRWHGFVQSLVLQLPPLHSANCQTV